MSEFVLTLHASQLLNGRDATKLIITCGLTLLHVHLVFAIILPEHIDLSSLLCNDFCNFYKCTLKYLQ